MTIPEMILTAIGFVAWIGWGVTLLAWHAERKQWAK